ncbi:MAG: prtC [Rhizobium sp.]|nr:prtC [Rhizobium sp.]
MLKLPVVVGFKTHGSDQPDDTVLVGEDTDDIGAPLHFLVQPFQWIGLDETLTDDVGLLKAALNGNDVVHGGSFQDTLFAGVGDDRIYGRAGDDTIFSEGDIIDLSKIDANQMAEGNNPFIYIGENEFTGKSAELRIERLVSQAVITGDIDEDEKADFEIHLDQLDRVGILGEIVFPPLTACRMLRLIRLIRLIRHVRDTPSL